MSSQRTEVVIGVADCNRLRRITRIVPSARNQAAGETACWQLWIHTNDFIFGTYLLLYDDGRVERWTDRADEGPQFITVKPPDMEDV